MNSKRVGAGKRKSGWLKVQTLGALRSGTLSLSPEIPPHFLFRPAASAGVEPSLAHAPGAPQPLRPAAPPQPGRGEPSPSYGSAGTAEATELLRLCWAPPPTSVPGSRGFRGAADCKMASRFTHERDGKEGTKMGWRLHLFFSVLTYPRYPK